MDGEHSHLQVHFPVLGSQELHLLPLMVGLSRVYSFFFLITWYMLFWNFTMHQSHFMKHSNVELETPPPLPVLRTIATTKTLIDNSGAHSNVPCLPFSSYFRISASPQTSEASECPVSVPKFPQHSALAAWERVSWQQQCLLCAVQNVRKLSIFPQQRKPWSWHVLMCKRTRIWALFYFRGAENKQKQE